MAFVGYNNGFFGQVKKKKGADVLFHAGLSFQHLLDRNLHRVTQRWDIIPAFKNEHCRAAVAGLQDASDNTLYPFMGHADVCVGIVHVDIIPGRYQDNIGIEPMDERRQDVLPLPRSMSFPESG